MNKITLLKCLFGLHSYVVGKDIIGMYKECEYCNNRKYHRTIEQWYTLK